jgi:hypothetical protein
MFSDLIPASQREGDVGDETGNLRIWSLISRKN